MSKISVIGAGSVGATVANDLMVQGIASEIVLIDINKKKRNWRMIEIGHVIQNTVLFTIQTLEYTI